MIIQLILVERIIVKDMIKPTQHIFNLDIAIFTGFI
jgi:hypothetical protein